MDHLICQCGGSFEDSPPTAEEEEKYGCGRPGCCVGAAICDKCGHRITISRPSPEVE
jgi:hypothetical protein